MSWFDEECEEALLMRQAAHEVCMDAVDQGAPDDVVRDLFEDLLSMRRQTARKIRRVRRKWSHGIVDNIDKCYEEKDTAGFYKDVKRLRGRGAGGARSMLRAADGRSLITDPAAVLDRWREYFRQLLNVPGPEGEVPLQAEVNAAPLDPPTLEQGRTGTKRAQAVGAPRGPSFWPVPYYYEIIIKSDGHTG